MELFAKYTLSVISAAFVVAIVSGLTDTKSSTGALIKLIGGLFLAFTIIQSFTRLDFNHISATLSSFSAESQTAAALGENLSAESLRSIIKAETEAYILDKAGLYRANLTVEVTLSQDEIPIPISVRLQGNVSPFAKYQLQQLIEDDLAIAKEDQVWMG